MIEKALNLAKISLFKIFNQTTTHHNTHLHFFEISLFKIFNQTTTPQRS